MKKIFYDQLTWPEIKEMWDDNKKVIVQTIGSTEQHGPHLPLCTDHYRTLEVVRRAVLKASEKIKVFIAPPIPWGYVKSQMDIPGEVDRHPGTISISPELIIRLLNELCDGFIRANFRKILIVNGHGENVPPIQTAAYMIGDRHGSNALIAVGNASQFGDQQKIQDLLVEKGPMGSGLQHASERETSMALALTEDLVDKSRIKKHPAALEIAKVKTRKFGGKVMVVETGKDLGTGGVGVMGDPTLATKEQGEKLVEIYVDGVAQLLIEFSTWEYGKK